jgi:hypothetical protein
MNRLADVLPGILLILSCVVFGASAHAHGNPGGAGHRAHTHGQAELDLAIDESGFEAELRIPMDSLVGFERAPANDTERVNLDQALAVLKDPERVLRATATAGCTGRLIGLEQPTLDGGASGHHDFEVRYRFDCAERARLLGVEAIVFDAFGRLRRVEVRSIGDAGTRSQRLGRSSRVLKISR